MNYLVWSNKHGAWWRPGHRGYTNSLHEAGRYTQAEAQEIVSRSNIVDLHRTNPVTGEAYTEKPEVMIADPGSSVRNIVDGATRPESQQDTDGITMRVTEVTVSAVPENNVNHHHFSIQVAWRGPGDTYAAVRHRMCLDANGTWDYEPRPSERTDEWIAAHRFPYKTAVALAATAVQFITVNGFTVADVLAAAQKDGEPK
jgi:hypothetical protein